MANTQEVNFDGPDQAEEEARADLYGLLAELFYAPPSKDLLEVIALTKAQGEGMIDVAWNALSKACETMPPEKIQEEYEQLFISVGKPEVILYGSYYMAGFMMEKPLAELRTELARLGLERGEAVAESEDHIAALCEVMRHLIAEGNADENAFAMQKRFFAEYIQPWANEMCGALAAHPAANFYATLSSLTKVFFEIESQAFEMV